MLDDYDVCTTVTEKRVKKKKVTKKLLGKLLCRVGGLEHEDKQESGGAIFVCFIFSTSTRVLESQHSNQTRTACVPFGYCGTNDNICLSTGGFVPNFSLERITVLSRKEI